MILRQTLGIVPVVALTIAACSSSAHRGPRGPERLFPDTSVWRPILQFTYEWLNLPTPGYPDSANVPWLITLPSDDPPWPSVEAQLRTDLGARVRLPSDTMYRTILIAPLSIRGDTVETHVSTGQHRRCQGSSDTKGSEGSQIVFVVPAEPIDGKKWSDVQRGTYGAGTFVCFGRP